MTNSKFLQGHRFQLKHLNISTAFESAIVHQDNHHKSQSPNSNNIIEHLNNTYYIYIRSIQTE